ncbi:alpha/beta hydrolase [Staphylococcus canis]|uniref:Prolyl oligopeptidase family serine peptidase n=1 Tax=Staphylococcus canis TaxID=2724942 RepID=A0ABS0T868_9STAP|nr:alpha/beta hydrolase family protein [Staphylococcus canis]MBI5974877.1 prolyl oligopeptidase family serine peptidase [Staphylococcus canis]
MAIMHMNYKSKTIGMHQSFVVILPEDETYFDREQTPKPLQSLLLLHGLSSDATSYTRYTSIERYANDYQLAVIMPNADHSFYTNMRHGHRYYDYVLEVWDYAHQILPLSKERKDHFIAGHSMGGYGTIKYALTQGERFAKAAPLSAVYDVTALQDFEWHDFTLENIVDMNDTEDFEAFSPHHLVEEAQAKGKVIPELLIMCGTEDILYPDNVAFTEFLTSKQIPYTFIEGKGDHDYAYWDQAIRTVIEKFTQND